MEVPVDSREGVRVLQIEWLHTPSRCILMILKKRKEKKNGRVSDLIAVLVYTLVSVPSVPIREQRKRNGNRIGDSSSQKQKQKQKAGEEQVRPDQKYVSIHTTTRTVCPVREI